MTSKRPCDTPHENDQARHRDVYTAVFVTGACLAAFLLRAWALTHRGVVDFDETYYYILGRNLFTGHGYTLNGLPHTAFPPLYPILVGFASLLAENIRVATSSVSAVAGALMPIPVYFLARDIYGRRVGLAAAAGVAAWPALFFFAALSVTYSQRLYSGSEPLFLLLVTTALLFLWRARRGAAFGGAAAAGAFLGFAALTRNEATLLLLVAGWWLVAQAALIGRARLKTAFAHAAVVAACFAIVVAPYVIYVHSVSGKWSFGSKLSNLNRTRPALWDWIVNDNSYAYVRIHNALNADASEMEDAYWGVAPYHQEGPHSPTSLRIALHVLRHPNLAWLVPFAMSFAFGFVPLVPLYMWPFVIAGAVVSAGRSDGPKYLALLFWLVAAYALIAVTMYSIARFHLPLVPLLAILAVAGLDAGAAAAGRAAARLVHRKAVAGVAYAVAVAVVVAVMAISGVMANIRGGRNISVQGACSSDESYLYVARVLGEKLPAGSTLMSNEPWLAVYAGMDWRAAPVDEPRRMIQYALKKGIHYAVLRKWQTGYAADAALFEPYLLMKIDTPRRDLYVYDFQKAGDGRGGSAGG